MSWSRRTTARMEKLAKELGPPLADQVRRMGLVWLTALALSAGSCASAWERCLDRGGQWFEGPATLPPDQQRGACVMPTKDGGKTCRDGSECSRNLCYCTGELSGPNAGGRSELEHLDGTQGTGQCATFPPGSGTGWRCLVVKGRIVIRGIIVD